MPAPPHIRPHHTRRRRVRRLLLIAGFTLATGVTGLVAVLSLMRATPSWWRAIALADAAAKAQGESVENAVLAQLSSVRPSAPGSAPALAPASASAPAPPSPQTPWHSEPWTIAITSEQATAWLNTRLYAWLVNQQRDDLWPGNIEQLQCAFEPGRILLGAKVRIGAASQVISLTLAPRIVPAPIDTDPAAMLMPAQGFTVGRMPVPLRWLFAAEQTEQSKALDAIFRGESPLTDRAVIDVDGARRVRVLDMQSLRGELHVTCVTEARAPR